MGDILGILEMPTKGTFILFYGAINSNLINIIEMVKLTHCNELQPSLCEVICLVLHPGLVQTVPLAPRYLVVGVVE